MDMNELQTVVNEGKERYITPIDHTGLPYCFAPSVRLPAPMTPQAENAKGEENRQADLNHMYPIYEVATCESPALASDIAKAALIGARVQWVDFGQHHYVYNQLFVGPELPQTDAGLFTALAMATAGYIPENALDLSGAEPKIIGLTTKQRKWLWTEGHVTVRCQSDVSRYLLDYVMASEIDHIPQIEVEEFLYTFDYDRRLQLGRKVVGQIIERAAEPLEVPYLQARAQDVLTFVRIGHEKKQAPNNPQDLVRAKLRAGKGFGYVQNALMMRLAGAPRRPHHEYLAGLAA
jgi:hypothetical protein